MSANKLIDSVLNGTPACDAIREVEALEEANANGSGKYEYSLGDKKGRISMIKCSDEMLDKMDKLKIKSMKVNKKLSTVELELGS